MGQEGSHTKSQINLSINHPRFHNSKVISQTNKRILQTEFGIDQLSYQKWQKDLSKKPSSQYLLLPIGYQFKKSGFCGSAGSLIIQYQDFPYLLTEEIYNRKGQKSKFSEAQMWSLLYALATVKKDVEGILPKVGDIRPQNIFLNETGGIKVANLLSWPGQVTNYFKTIQGEKTYLSPQGIAELEKCSTQNMNQDLCQIFSIGLTLLSVGTLTDLSYFYSSKSEKFDYNAATQKLNQWRIMRYYSEILRATIINLCQFDAKLRVTPQQFWGWIHKYQESIKKKQSFIINDAPTKLHQEVQSLRATIPVILQNSRQKQVLYSFNQTGPLIQHYPPNNLPQINPVSRTIIEKSHTSIVESHSLGHGSHSPLKQNPPSKSPPKQQIVSSGKELPVNNQKVGISGSNIKLSPPKHESPPKNKS